MIDETILRHIGMMDEKDIDGDQLTKGTQHEMEHTDDPEEARQIALDHRTEIPDYYDRLDKLEAEAKAEGVMNHAESNHAEIEMSTPLGFAKAGLGTIVAPGDQLTKDGGCPW